MDRLDEGRSKLRKLAIGAKVCIALVVLVGLAAISMSLFRPFDVLGGGYFSIEGTDLWLVTDIAMLASSIPIGMWIYRAHANLEAADLPGLEYTPGWSIGWFFVPFASLWKPFSAMRELWNASHGAVGDYSENPPGLLWIWWLSWLLRSFGSFEALNPMLEFIGIAALIASAASLWMIVDAVTRQQESFGLGHVFA